MTVALYFNTLDKKSLLTCWLLSICAFLCRMKRSPGYLPEYIYLELEVEEQ